MSERWDKHYEERAGGSVSINGNCTQVKEGAKSDSQSLAKTYFKSALYTSSIRVLCLLRV